ncbi:uncharacterized protein SCHCODRAFT_02552772 [Schizophyllum commune H4-8]|uniref:uncharacterized protein n=1 Tax=Schizophyllum commune (strain H4-8 / FGSC 9210) TaxID=578458 RepID=UPI00216068A5|nr:uncharacterized protein SCHCODRAFT_02552772 [Schizophyllum commune H4-8]KAI5887645.1 hypothetical protein SCHCODRAFT_02552772 [Schizophyllum commune H4-8]
MFISTAGPLTSQGLRPLLVCAGGTRLCRFCRVTGTIVRRLGTALYSRELAVHVQTWSWGPQGGSSIRLR